MRVNDLRRLLGALPGDAEVLLGEPGEEANVARVEACDGTVVLRTDVHKEWEDFFEACYNEARLQE